MNVMIYQTASLLICLNCCWVVRDSTDWRKPLCWALTLVSFACWAMQGWWVLVVD
jgi:hypothetical protein